MSLFSRKPASHLVPVHPDNARKSDWIILLEAGTIVGTPREKLRVARTTTERKVVKRYSLFRKTRHFLVVDGYDPRIHALYFCPQLYKYDQDKLVPLQGEEIGALIAQSLEAGVNERRPWYEPLDKTPDEPIINAPMVGEFDAVVVEMPARKSSSSNSLNRRRVRSEEPGSDGEQHPAGA
jgi:hypothetical protein